MTDISYIDVAWTYQHKPLIVDLEIKVSIRVYGAGDWSIEGFAVEESWRRFKPANSHDPFVKLILAELQNSEEFREHVETELYEQMEAAE